MQDGKVTPADECQHVSQQAAVLYLTESCALKGTTNAGMYLQKYLHDIWNVLVLFEEQGHVFTHAYSVFGQKAYMHLQKAPCVIRNKLVFARRNTTVYYH